MAGVGAVILFSVGVAAAFADSPPTTEETTTSTTTSSEPTTTTTTSSTSTTTTTLPAPTTTTTTTSTTTSTTTAPTTPTTTPTSPRRKAAPAAASKRRANATAKSPRKQARRGQRHKKRRRLSKPLKVTPPLGLRHYVFPVVGESDYVDTYGDFRSDVHGKWHHGDDIFAPLGAPVVAVATGTINRVGWRKAGGWRLWVRDSAANEFYYAHLSGYARSVFHSRHVTAGQVIGFVCNTGDAFPRAPHLHFEIHPRQLLRMHYDGAVDPTTYLDSWTHLTRVDAPRPMHPRLPKQLLVRREARQVFGQLLVARHLIQQAEPNKPARVVVPAASVPLVAQLLPTPEAAPASGHKGRWQLVTSMLLGVTSLALLTAATLRARVARRTRRASGPAAEAKPVR
jgi:murein DD-endopeptidase MepM/ murein hydrolase activator NlpD